MSNHRLSWVRTLLLAITCSGILAHIGVPSECRNVVILQGREEYKCNEINKVDRIKGKTQLPVTEVRIQYRFVQWKTLNFEQCDVSNYCIADSHVELFTKCIEPEVRLVNCWIVLVVY